MLSSVVGSDGLRPGLGTGMGPLPVIGDDELEKWRMAQALGSSACLPRVMFPLPCCHQ